MDKANCSSDSDLSDEDFCPENVESEELSENESDASNSEPEENNKTSLKKTKKIKRNKDRASLRKNRAYDDHVKESGETGDSKNTTVLGLDDEAEKKRSDALWADFLSDVSGSSKDTGSSPSCVTPNITGKQSNEKNLQPKVPEKIKITEVFDFAGEEIKITKEISARNLEDNKSTEPNKLKSATRVLPTFYKGPVKRPSSGGISSILNTIGKKSKISVLEKSKVDWDTFKKTEGLNEELKTFNKGRDGYLERQDFLARTDVKQFEIEKGLRQTKRSN